MSVRSAGCLRCTRESAERSWSTLNELPASLTKQTILPSRRCSMVDSFRFLFITFPLSKLMTAHAHLVLEQGHELAVERIHLAAAHTFLVNRPVEMHVPVERIRNQAEHPEIEGMHV